ncbi:TPA: GTPase Obg 1, variant 3 [Trebouxia sp. C0005]
MFHGQEAMDSSLPAAHHVLSNRTKTSALTDDVYTATKSFCRSGAGGRGEVSDKAGGKMVDNFKYKPGGNMPKKIWLGNSDPGDGFEGSSVVLYVDLALDSLLHLHERSKWTAPNGAQGDPTKGSDRPKTQAKRSWTTAPTRIPVPRGTVVKRKRGGALLADLTHPGESVVVARGGKGGMGVTRPTREDNARLQTRKRRFLTEADTAVSEYIVEDDDWKAEAAGAPGEEVSLHLMLRVVADVGIVGFPNAGKSSLLAAITRASPEVAPYPFTTVTPNLGVTQIGNNAEAGRMVLADLPGLIQGAHQGRGLGRMFLRHLRRTRIILHVVDAATDDPAMDYWAVREELRMYNPEYCARPHIVALNKMDLQEAAHLQAEIAAEVLTMAHRIQNDSPEGNPQPSLPAAVVCVSAQAGTGLDDLHAALEPLLPAPSTAIQASASSSTGDGWG